ncbi:MAG: flagellar hook basal-body protein [Deltaproteobacteria bacterium]|nr:flagellar hook basal-body protein [Deltaproteobacteria bacterium]
MAGIGTALYTGVSGLRAFSTAISVVSDNVANAGTTAFKANEIRFADLVGGYYSKWSDIAINGEGFFQVQDSNGNIFYTRDGSFYVDLNGNMISYLGYQLLDSSESPIQLETDTYSNFVIQSNGEIYGVDADGNMSDTPLATIGLVNFRDPNGLIRVGNNLFREGANAGKDGYTIEGSNVDLAEELVNLIVYQANYNANTKTVSTAADMLNATVNIVR